MSEDERRETLREAKILEVLQHPNIVRFKEVYKTKKGKLCIVMDYADGGDLQGKIKEKYKIKEKNGGQLQYWSEDHVLNWFTQICLALKHVHDRKILHRDLKSQNIFITKNGLIKLGDFGIARVLSDTRSKAKTVVGTPYYLSPEIIKSEPYSFKSDIWSLGVLLYEMCALQPPFNASSLHQLAQKIIQGQYAAVPGHFSKNINALLSSMLQRDPAKRPNINQLLKSPIIADRIRKLLNEDDFKDEFSHTILHNQNVFDEFRAIQAKKKAEEEQKKKEALKEEESKRMQAELDKKLAAMNLNQYKPKYGQDPQMFNQMYMNYIEQLNQDADEISTPSAISERPYSQQSSQIAEEDRGDQQEEDSEASSASTSSRVSATSQNQLINISACEFGEFQKYMISQYGENQFKQGYEIIKMNRNVLYEDNGEQKLGNMLKGLNFTDGEQMKGFINFCTTYLIVQNMQVS